MNQIFVCFFGLVSLVASGCGIWCEGKAKLRYKPAWIFGCLFGFVGFGLEWTKPDDLYFLIGVQIPL